MLEVTNLPADRSHSGLMLSLRIMTEQAMSDATVLFSHFVQEGNTNKEHQRYPGRALIHNGSSYQSARTPAPPPPPLFSHELVLFAQKPVAAAMSDVVVMVERATKIDCIDSLSLVQFKFFSRPVTSWKRVLSHRGREIPEQTTRTHEWYVHPCSEYTVEYTPFYSIIRLNLHFSNTSRSRTTVPEFVRIVPKAMSSKYENRNAVKYKNEMHKEGRPSGYWVVCDFYI